MATDIPQGEEARVELAPVYEPLIGDEMCVGLGPTFPALDPATGHELAEVRAGTAEDVAAAVEAARNALPAWANTSVEERATLLARLADAVEQDAPRLSLIDALDIGRRWTETSFDYQIAAGQYRYFAAAAQTHHGSSLPIENGVAVVKREPIGVCGQIIPWNVPAIMVALKLAPALATGNTIVLKPDEHASLSTMELAAKIAEIFPPGVVNVVPGVGSEAGAALTGHPDVAKLAFTGSTEVGYLIAEGAARRLAPATLELGGKSANIVFPDVHDLRAVVDNVALALAHCNGQSCFAGTRLFLHDEIYDEFLGELTAGFENMRIAPPLDPSSQLSCLVSERQGERVLGYIEAGESEGANLVSGGKRVEVEGASAGYFIAPTIFEARNDHRIAQEEIFGPVLCVLRWSDFDTMIREANGVRYGLAAGVYSSDLDNAMRTADALEAGSVWVNQYMNFVHGTPFGGYKDSGVGREYWTQTMDLYTNFKTITLSGTAPPPWYLS